MEDDLGDGEGVWSLLAVTPGSSRRAGALNMSLIFVRINFMTAQASHPPRIRDGGLTGVSL
jgi:hypothetical protein